MYNVQIGQAYVFHLDSPAKHETLFPFHVIVYIEALHQLARCVPYTTLCPVMHGLLVYGDTEL